jgi:hypothetical protein
MAYYEVWKLSNGYLVEVYRRFGHVTYKVPTKKDMKRLVRAIKRKNKLIKKGVI